MGRGSLFVKQEMQQEIQLRGLPPFLWIEEFRLYGRLVLKLEEPLQALGLTEEELPDPVGQGFRIISGSWPKPLTTVSWKSIGPFLGILEGDLFPIYLGSLGRGAGA